LYGDSEFRTLAQGLDLGPRAAGPRTFYKMSKRTYSSFIRSVAPVASRLAVSAARSYIQSRMSNTSSRRGRGSTVRRQHTYSGWVKKPRMFTVGKRGPNFKKGKKPRTDLNRVLGYEQIRENRGVVTDAHLVGIAHGTPAFDVLFSTWAAVFRKIFERAGFGLSDWNEGMDFHGITSLTFNIVYRPTQQQAAQSTLSHAFTNLSSYYVNIENLIGTIADTITTSTQQFVVDYVYLSGSGFNQRMSVRNMSINLGYSSKLVLQNRTAGATISDTEATDVTNNPLTGRRWEVKGNFVEPKTKSWDNSISTVSSFVVNPDSGVITGGAGISGLGSVKKVGTPDEVMRCLGTKRVGLAPGEIRVSTLSYNKTLSLNTIIHHLLNYIKHSTSANVQTFRDTMKVGKTAMFQFEKLCDTRVTDDQLVTLGYEHNCIMGARVVRVGYGYTTRHEIVE
jgi:hypothetical protein